VRLALAAAAVAVGIVPALLGCGATASKPPAGPSSAVAARSLAPVAAPVAATTTSTPLARRALAAPAPVSQPAIYQWPIPYGSARKHEMAAYSLRHYGESTAVLSHPKVIVEHYTDTATAQEAFNTFASDEPDSEFHELPNTCAHFLVERSGRIDQLVALSLRCRHTTGLNWTAIGIEHVGFSDQAVLSDPAQIRASLRLTRWLRCRYAIALKNVIGHNESLASPYHRDLVPAFQHQTHSDWNHADMSRYRSLLARLACR
jgi:hypothetical protein